MGKHRRTSDGGHLPTELGHLGGDPGDLGDDDHGRAGTQAVNVPPFPAGVERLSGEIGQDRVCQLLVMIFDRPLSEWPTL